MTTAERDLVETIRAELASIDPTRRCCRAAEVAGLTGAFEPRRRTIARLELRLGRSRAGEGAVALAPAGSASVAPAPFDWSRAAEHCRVAYLRGRFLAHGSLSLASGRTHLEFVLSSDEASQLCDQLNRLEMPATWRLRRGRGVVTWKSVETVTTFLKVVGGGSALLEVESRQVLRSVRGDLNRVINAESANLGRAVAAAADQLEAIDTLEADGRLADQPYVVRLVADARREEPEATFTELAERLELHRSSVQRALERIQRLALHADEAVGQRGRPRR
jgi:DNA-binding transcriptional regulator WhiA